MMRLALLFALLLQDDSAKAILDRFAATRPAGKDLAIYTLDWEPSLKVARDRAAKEERPILLIVVTNGYGDMYTGHC